MKDQQEKKKREGRKVLKLELILEVSGNSISLSVRSSYVGQQKSRQDIDWTSIHLIRCRLLRTGVKITITEVYVMS